MMTEETTQEVETTIGVSAQFLQDVIQIVDLASARGAIMGGELEAWAAIRKYAQSALATSNIT